MADDYRKTDFDNWDRKSTLLFIRENLKYYRFAGRAKQFRRKLSKTNFQKSSYHDIDCYYNEFVEKFDNNVYYHYYQIKNEMKDKITSKKLEGYFGYDSARDLYIPCEIYFKNRMGLFENERKSFEEDSGGIRGTCKQYQELLESNQKKKHITWCISNIVAISISFFVVVLCLRADNKIFKYGLPVAAYVIDVIGLIWTLWEKRCMDGALRIADYVSLNYQDISDQKLRRKKFADVSLQDIWKFCEKIVEADGGSLIYTQIMEVIGLLKKKVAATIPYAIFPTVILVGSVIFFSLKSGFNPHSLKPETTSLIETSQTAEVADHELSTTPVKQENPTQSSEPSKTVISAEAVKTTKTGVTYVAAVSSLNVMKEPDTYGTVLSTLHLGDEINVEYEITTSNRDIWYNVLLPDGRKGWVSRRNVKLIFPQAANIIEARRSDGTPMGSELYDGYLESACEFTATELNQQLAFTLTLDESTQIEEILIYNGYYKDNEFHRYGKVTEVAISFDDGEEVICQIETEYNQNGYVIRLSGKARRITIRPTNIQRGASTENEIRDTVYISEIIVLK